MSTQLTQEIHGEIARQVTEAMKPRANWAFHRAQVIMMALGHAQAVNSVERAALLQQARSAKVHGLPELHAAHCAALTRLSQRDKAYAYAAGDAFDQAFALERAEQREAA